MSSEYLAAEIIFRLFPILFFCFPILWLMNRCYHVIVHILRLISTGEKMTPIELNIYHVHVSGCSSIILAVSDTYSLGYLLVCTDKAFLLYRDRCSL